ncbi:restriction endonuclease subunit S [Heyndrickxia coagulans]|uniref:restriction endonuclease subunit S n=2 Tax=Heyndrickxia coagulans TaxID=1398 RepID=UPI00036A34D3|nr:restriction endonuclease subunit S [Heyndrickxia coagulans]
MRKKQKTMEELLEEALVPEKEQPYEVPGNWVWTYTGSIAEVVGGGTPKTSVKEFYKGGTIPWITPADLSGYKKILISNGKRNITELGLAKSSAKMLPINSVLLSSRAPIGYVAIASHDLCTNQGFKSFLPSKAYYPQYLYWYLKSSKPYLESMASGSTFKEISATRCKEIMVPLPPLNEQIRIANKVERLLSKIDEAKRLIEEAKETFELRRAAILDKAIRGEMMEKSHISRESNANLYEIPINWKWKTFGDVAQVCSNLVDPKQYLELPHIAPDNIEKGTGQLLEYQTIEESKVKSPKHYFKKGQILYSKIRPYLSKVIIAEFEGLCSADMYPIETDLDAKYLFWYMLSPFFVEKASTAGSRSVLPKINKKELGNIPIPVPPKETQKKIVRIIESALSREKQTIGYLESIVGLMEKLKQSILSKAFRGELGTNDPTEESAIELLKEVLQEQVK